MRAKAVEAGKPRTVLVSGPVPMKNPRAWSQFDSDIVAHFLQVHAQISKSRWRKSKVTYTIEGDKIKNPNFPSFEDFVFAAMYFRQLILEKDALLDEAISRYSRHVDSDGRRAWIDVERRDFYAVLDGNCFPMLSGYKVRELFDSFLYGASLFHRPPHPKNRLGPLFLKIYDTEPREQVLFTLNSSLGMLLNHVGNAAVVIHQDFAFWLHQYHLPLPNVRWHDRLFEIDDKK